MTIQPDEAFMADLFADLDATTFLSSSPTTSQRLPSSSLPKRSPFMKSQRTRLSNCENVPPLPSSCNTFSPKQKPNPTKGKQNSTRPSFQHTSFGAQRHSCSPQIHLTIKSENTVSQGSPTGRPTLNVDAKREKENLFADQTKAHVLLQDEVEENTKLKMEYDKLLGDVDWNDEFEELSHHVSSPAIIKKKRADPPRSSKAFTRATVEDVVQKISHINNKLQKILRIKIQDHEDPLQVELMDDWIQTPVEAGDTINLIGDLDKSRTPCMVLDCTSGLLILHPDILVSSTKVADSSACARRAMLQEIIRSTGHQNLSMTYGNMLHELMQACLMEGKWDQAFLHERIDDIILNDMQTLWSLDVEPATAKKSLLLKSEVFEKFQETFMAAVSQPQAFLSDLRSNQDEQARLSIVSVVGVEEDIWAPKYGLKGKIDASILGKIAEPDRFSASIAHKQDAVMLPFEIKTGRSIAGMEHRAQTMLYTLLMTDRYDENVSSGLLYYMQSNSVIRVQAARNEVRGLIIARNEFATFFNRRMTLSKKRGKRDEDPEENISLPAGSKSPTVKPIKLEDKEVMCPDIEETPLLPAPIDEGRACTYCFAADACMVFRRAVEGHKIISEDPENALQVRYERKTSHITDGHASFFKTWERLITLEEQEVARFKKEIWTMGAEERMKLGRCMASMVIDTSFNTSNPKKAGQRSHRFTYRLQPLSSGLSQHNTRSLLGGNISINDPIVISLEQPHVLSISRGFILEISSTSVVVGLESSLNQHPQAVQALKVGGPQSNLIFRVDKDELAAGMGRTRDNLLQLFAKDSLGRLRALVVDLETPTFRENNVADVSIDGKLNSDQVQALKKVLSSEDYALILGMPGTGKTTTIAEILKALAKAGKSVLLTSYTHSAVDNILLKVIDSGLSILRLGNRDKIMPALYNFTLDPENPARSLSQLDDQLVKPQIVATTCLSVNEPIFLKRRFDYCIVDEASQVTLPTCLGPLRYADKFILVGDHNQLPPLVRNLDARQGGLETSLFKRLSDAHPHSIVSLTHQYRMNADIMFLSSKLIYGDRLRAGSKEVAERRLKLPRAGAVDNLGCLGSSCSNGCWVQDILHPRRTVVFMNTDSLPARENKAGPLIENEAEASLVLQTAAALVRCGVVESDIGIIALYRQQIKLLARKLEAYPDVEVLTADRSQGRDKECIIMSLTRSNTEGQVGDLLKDWRRINVCLTRAKSKLVMFGSRSTLANVPLLLKFFNLAEEQGWMYNLGKEAESAHPSLSPLGRKRPGDAELTTRGLAGLSDKKSRAIARQIVSSKPLVRDILNCM